MRSAGLKAKAPHVESATAKYRRIVLKLSGEALQGKLGYGIDPAVLDDLARQIK